MRKNFKENIVVFGGTFDPIHMGHLAVVDYTLRNNIASCVMLVPSGVPPFKSNRVSLSKEERLYLCRLALIDYKNIYGSEYSDRVFINDYELNSPTYSYTSETIKHIKNTYMIEDKVNFIIGDDIVDELPKWHDAQYLKNNVRFILFNRSDNKENAIKNLMDDGYDFFRVLNPTFEFSSSCVRGQKMYDMLSPLVKEEYISILKQKGATFL